MNFLVKVFKGIGIGLFRLNLWLPVLYSMVFLILTLTIPLSGVWGYYLFGVVICLFGSLALTYFSKSKKSRKGEFKKSVAKDEQFDGESDYTHGKTKEKRKLLVRNSRAQEPEPQISNIPQNIQNTYSGYNNQGQYGNYPPQNQDYGYTASQNYDYYNQQAEYNRQMQARQAIYGQQSGYPQSQGGYEEQQAPAGDAMSRLYPEKPASRFSQESKPKPTAFDIYPEEPAPRFASENKPAFDLYPEQPAPRFAPENKPAYNLYPDSPASGVQNPFNVAGGAMNSLYPEDNTSFRQDSGRRHASELLYTNEREQQSSDSGFDRRNASDFLYQQKPQQKSGGQPEFRGFSSYVQPVNAVGQQPGQRIPHNLPKDIYDGEEQLKKDDEFLMNVNINPLSSAKVMSRRTEKPLNIYATRSDPNTYVYEYEDRYEFIQLLEGENKRLLKTEFK